ncbi:MAG: YgfZ/GcvT domain-containing protein [Zwartia sp.]
MHPILTQPLTPQAASLPEALVIYPLEDVALFEATGADALSFLQGQITNDILSAGPEQARLAGYCTAQGRLLATMVMTALPDAPAGGLIGLMRRDILASVLKRLSMFVLRAKVKFGASTYSAVGASIAAHQVGALTQVFGHTLPTIAWQAASTATGLWICAPTASIQPDVETLRWWWLASEAQAALCQDLKLSQVLGTSEQWHCQDIAAGLPWIEAATQDLLIPQTLNLDLIEGVSFTKGCYPGQEIVARSHYRGTVKRRMHFGKIDAAQTIGLKAGADIFDAQGSEQACGRVINIASSVQSQPEGATKTGDAGTTYVLFETTFDALEHNALHLSAPDGAPITLLSLPYSTKPA